SAAPPVRYPNVYGIDMPSPREFVADRRSVEEIAQVIGADWLLYQDLDDLIAAVQRGNKKINHFDCSCFDGEYITKDVNADYLKHLDDVRSDNAKQNRKQTNLAGIDLHSSQ
ncbi:MAG: amidophosphoribosyltransferase, partial [Gammaproteobacteria bacterium]|nr:amidophosphoribosyltransferase [Gammaproteobacteria bacterium]